MPGRISFIDESLFRIDNFVTVFIFLVAYTYLNGGL